MFSSNCGLGYLLQHCHMLNYRNSGYKTHFKIQNIYPLYISWKEGSSISVLRRNTFISYSDTFLIQSRLRSPYLAVVWSVYPLVIQVCIHRSLLNSFFYRNLVNFLECLILSLFSVFIFYFRNFFGKILLQILNLYHFIFHRFS